MKCNEYLDAFGNEVGIVELVLLGDVAFGELGELNHLGYDLLLVVRVAQVHQSGDYAVHDRHVAGLRRASE